MYTLENYTYYAKFLPSFFKDFTTGDKYEFHEIHDVRNQTPVPTPENAVATIWVWSYFSLEAGSKGRFYFVDSNGYRIKEGDTEFTDRIDLWLEDVRQRKEEFDAFITDKRPFEIRAARPE